MKTSARNSLFMPVSVGLVTLALAAQAFGAPVADRSVDEQKYWASYETGLNVGCKVAKISRAELKDIAADRVAYAGYAQARHNVAMNRDEFCAPGALEAIKSNYVMNNTRYAEAAPSAR